MLEDLFRDAQRLLQSKAFIYVLGGLFIVIWWAVSTVVGLVRRRPADDEPRPRRRLPLR